MKKSISLPVSIIISGILLFYGLYILTRAVSETPFFNSSPPSYLTVDQPDVYGDYLYDNQAARYICVEYDEFARLVESGGLDGTFASYYEQYEDEYGNKKTCSVYIFSKAKLNEWMLNKIENSEPIK